MNSSGGGGEAGFASANPAAEAGKQDARFALQKRIQALDGEIDAHVYRLYGLTEAEIEVVEGG
jgi:hypothetical protein